MITMYFIIATLALLLTTSSITTLMAASDAEEHNLLVLRFDNFPNVHALTPVLIDTMEEYIKHHSIKAIESDPNFCSRNFIVGTYACPQLLGNRLAEFLNNFAGAFITNRTIIWTFCGRKMCSQDSVAICEQFLSRAKWIPSFEATQKMWIERNCTGSISGKPNSVGAPTIHHLIPSKFRFQSGMILLCCGLDKLKFPFLDYGTMELREFFSLSLNESRTHLDDVYYHRAKLLFDKGEDYGYGILFRSSFSIRPELVMNNNAALKNASDFYGSSTSDTIMIGVHLRHSKVDDVHGQENGESSCMNQIIAKYHPRGSSKRCFILLASDRADKIEQWRHRAMSEWNCFLVLTNHTSAYPKDLTPLWENGPFTGEIAFKDIDMLSRSDVFMGSSYSHHGNQFKGMTSTFSLLIAALRATSGREMPLLHPAVFIPTCTVALAGKVISHDKVYSPTFQCGNNALTGILLPQYCPFWNKTELQENQGRQYYNPGDYIP